ncbi:hypothetical protein EDD15DRAFT_1383756 [Pisolithus albus]|nr:hypothetical protein EDD15DRAFT_1383756 [Pisolithus albus]
MIPYKPTYVRRIRYTGPGPKRTVAAERKRSIHVIGLVLIVLIAWHDSAMRIFSILAQSVTTCGRTRRSQGSSGFYSIKVITATTGRRRPETYPTNSLNTGRRIVAHQPKAAKLQGITAVALRDTDFPLLLQTHIIGANSSTDNGGDERGNEEGK